jgi:uncharacterized protein DUF2589
MPPPIQEQATGLLGQIPFGAVIGGPLKAAVEAQSLAAVTCYDFINNIGFEKPDKDDDEKKSKAIRTISFFFEREEGDKKARTTITVPLLTIMPLPFIRIESMTVNFKASISAVDSSSQSDSSSMGADSKLEAGVGFAVWKASLSGTVSSKKDSTATNTSKYSVEHTIDISVHAVQDDMPAGLAKMLSILTDSIRISSATV